MAALSTSDRLELAALLARDVSAARVPLTLSRTDLRAAVTAADDWAEANAAAFNTALPVIARTALTAKQKAQLLMHVLRRRYEVT